MLALVSSLQVVGVVLGLQAFSGSWDTSVGATLPATAALIQERWTSFRGIGSAELLSLLIASAALLLRRRPQAGRRWRPAGVVWLVAGLGSAGAVFGATAHAQHASPLARVEALDLDTTKVGRVTAYFRAADREHAERLAALCEEAAAHFEDELGTSFPLHLAVLRPGDWFDPGRDDAGSYGEPWARVQDLLISVPASLDEGVLILGPDDAANSRRVEFVMLHELGHLANKRYLHPESSRPYSSVKWFEEFLATYFAYAFVRSHDPEWADASHGEWVDFIEGYTPRVLSLDWTFMREIPPEEQGLTYAWYQILLNLRAAAVYEEHGLDFLRQVKDRMAWDEAGEWTTESVLSTLEGFVPGFKAWGEDPRNGDLTQDEP